MPLISCSSSSSGSKTPSRTNKCRIITSQRPPAGDPAPTRDAASSASFLSRASNLWTLSVKSLDTVCGLTPRTLAAWRRDIPDLVSLTAASRRAATVSLISAGASDPWTGAASVRSTTSQSVEHIRFSASTLLSGRMLRTAGRRSAMLIGDIDDDTGFRANLSLLCLCDDEAAKSPCRAASSWRGLSLFLNRVDRDGCCASPRGAGHILWHRAAALFSVRSSRPACRPLPSGIRLASGAHDLHVSDRPAARN